MIDPELELAQKLALSIEDFNMWKSIVALNDKMRELQAQTLSDDLNAHTIKKGNNEGAE